MPIYALGDDEPDIDESAFVHPDAVVIGRVRIGPEASVWPCAVLRGDHGRIEIGPRTSIQDGTVIHCTSEYSTFVGRECVVGHNAHLEGCVVEDQCLIGSGAVVLNRAVVGARSGRRWRFGDGGLRGPGHRPGRRRASHRQTEPRISPDIAAANMNTYLESARRYRSDLRRLNP